MTVEELIEKLNQITDKTKQVMFVGMYEDVVIEQVKEQKEEVIIS